MPRATRRCDLRSLQHPSQRAQQRGAGAERAHRVGGQIAAQHVERGSVWPQCVESPHQSRTAGRGALVRLGRRRLGQDRLVDPSEEAAEDCLLRPNCGRRRGPAARPRRRPRRATDAASLRRQSAQRRVDDAVGVTRRRRRRCRHAVRLLPAVRRLSSRARATRRGRGDGAASNVRAVRRHQHIERRARRAARARHILAQFRRRSRLTGARARPTRRPWRGPAAARDRAAARPPRRPAPAPRSAGRRRPDRRRIPPSPRRSAPRPRPRRFRRPRRAARRRAAAAPR